MDFSWKPTLSFALWTLPTTASLWPEWPITPSCWTRPLFKLKPRQRQLVWLAHVEGLSHIEVAEVLGVKAASVRLMVFRARKRLAELLREQGYRSEVTT